MRQVKHEGGMSDVTHKGGMSHVTHTARGKSDRHSKAVIRQASHTPCITHTPVIDTARQSYDRCGSLMYLGTIGWDMCAK